MTEVPLLPGEVAEIAMFNAHYAAHKASGTVNIQLNYHEGRLATVVVNGRRFERRSGLTP